MKKQNFCRSVAWLQSLTITIVATILVLSATATAEEDVVEVTSSVVAKTKSSWSIDSYPIPDHDPTLCRTELSRRICDPDSIIPNEEEIQQIETILLDKPIRQLHNPKSGSVCYKYYSDQVQKYNLEKDNGIGKENADTKQMILQVQYGVALMNKIDSEPGSYDKFAQSIHDKWGVGYDYSNECGASTNVGSGALIVLSKHDRFIYISRGALLSTVFTDRRLNTIMEQMKPLLREGLYAKAIVTALSELDVLLLKGEPSFFEKAGEYVVAFGGLWYVVSIFIITFITVHRDNIKRREYAAVASQLSELDLARAQALQGQFQAKSCPICLEPFKMLPATITATNNNLKVHPTDDFKKSNSDALSKDNTKILHETNISVSEDSSTNAAAVPEPEDRSAPESQPDTIGSDNLPVKLLRCGHIFDSTCWEEWISSGQGTVNKCPICQQDVGGQSTPLSSDDNRRTTRTTSYDQGNAVLSRRRTASNTELSPSETSATTTTMQNVVETNQNRGTSTDTTDDTSSLTESLLQPSLEESRELVSSVGHDSTSNSLSQYTRDRNFRLLRLAARYPQYIQQQHIQRWTSVNYDGSLARDPSFVQNDPSIRQGSGNSSSNNSSSSGSSIGGSSGISSGFGGGSSSGGRGSRW